MALSPGHLLRPWREAEQHICVKIRAIRTALLRLGKSQCLILRTSGNATAITWHTMQGSTLYCIPKTCFTPHDIAYLYVPVVCSDVVGEAAGLQCDDLPHEARCACMQVNKVVYIARSISQLGIKA
jgi:hypothetical protein